VQIPAFLEQMGVIPVVEIPSAASAVELAKVLTAAGLPCAEITFRTSAAEEAIAAVVQDVPGFCVGAGTILTDTQARAAIRAGAQFLVAPGLDPEVIAVARDHNRPMIPGVCTPTEIQTALSHGLTEFKLFPAEACGGVQYLKAVAAPFRGARFVPTGGISAANLAAYLSLPSVLAAGGSWMVKKDLIASADWARIRELTEEAVEIVRVCRAAPDTEANGVRA